MVSPTYPIVVCLVFAAGLGIAAFHPEGAKFAAYASGRKRASGMSYFNIGGNTGYALGAFATGELVALARAGPRHGRHDPGPGRGDRAAPRAAEARPAPAGGDAESIQEGEDDRRAMASSAA